MYMQANGFRFSRQEEKVLALSMSGLSDKEIARRMEIGLGTVRTFWKRIRSKAGGSTRAEVISAMSRVAADQELEEAHEQNIQLIAEIKRRQTAEEETRKREREFSMLAEAVPAGVFAVSDTKLQFVNDHAEQWFGADQATIDKDPWLRIHPDERESAERSWEQAGKDHTTFEMELRLLYLDGTYRWCLVRAVPRQIGEPQTIRWLGTITDIHDLKEAEIVYRDLFECSRDAVFLVGSDGQILDVNQAVTEILGYSKRELLSMTTRDFVVPGMEEHYEAARVALRENDIWRGVFPVVAKNGLPMKLDWTTTYRASPDKIVAIARPITEPRPVVQEKVFEQAFEKAKAGIAVVSLDGTLQLINERFAELLGHQPQAMQGLRLPSFVTFSDRKRLESCLVRADTEGDAQAGLSMLHANGGLISVLMDVASVVDEGKVLQRVVTLRRTADSSRRY